MSKSTKEELNMTIQMLEAKLEQQKLANDQYVHCLKGRLEHIQGLYEEQCRLYKEKSDIGEKYIKGTANIWEQNKKLKRELRELKQDIESLI